MTKVKKILKAILYYTGVYRILISIHRNCIPILMIHGVLDEDSDTSWQPGWQRTTREQLDRVLSVLGRYYRFTSMDEVSTYLVGESAIEAPVLALTFDDGYRNALTDAYSVLKFYSAPAIIYLVAGCLDNQKPLWIDRLDYVLQLIPSSTVSIELSGRKFNIRLKERCHFVHDYHQFRLGMKSSFLDDVQMLQELESEIGSLEMVASKSLLDIFAEDRVAGLLTAADLKQFDSSISFGSHTVNHLRVNRISRDRLEWELSESKASIESATELDCTHFCYPNGDIDKISIELLRNIGYQTAVTTIVGSNRVGDSDLLALKRISIPVNRNHYEILHDVVVSLFRSDRVVL